MKLGSVFADGHSNDSMFRENDPVHRFNPTHTMRAMRDEFDRGSSLSDAFGGAYAGTWRDHPLWRGESGKAPQDAGWMQSSSSCDVVRGSSPHVHQETVQYERR